MKKIAKISVMLVSISAALLNGCKKPEKGETGPAGTNGNANVISSDTIVLNNWSTDFDNGTEFDYSDTVIWAPLTQAIKDKGMIMVYGKEVGDVEWIAMPYSFVGVGYSYTFNFFFNTGSVIIEFSGYDNAGSPGNASLLNGEFVIRVVAIPASGIKKLNDSNIDIKNYQEVKECLKM